MPTSPRTIRYRNHLYVVADLQVGPKVEGAIKVVERSYDDDVRGVYRSGQDYFGVIKVRWTASNASDTFTFELRPRDAWTLTVNIGRDLGGRATANESEITRLGQKAGFLPIERFSDEPEEFGEEGRYTPPGKVIDIGASANASVQQRSSLMSNREDKITQPISITAKRKKKEDLEAPGEKRQPGSTSTHLRRLMSDPLADIFSEVGVELYEKAVKAIQDDLTEIFSAGVKDLGGKVTKKLGEYGYDESKEHFRQWMKDIVADVVDSGISEIVGSLEAMISSLSSTYAEGEGGEGAEESILGMDIPEVSEGEVEAVEEVAETPPEGGLGEEAPAEATPLTEETPAATATPAPAGGIATGVPEATAGTDKPRTFRVTPELRQVYASSKKRFKLQSIAAKRIAAVAAEESK